MSDQECTETESSEPELLKQRSGVFERRHIEVRELPWIMRRHILTGCQGTVRGAVSIGPLGAVGVGGAAFDGKIPVLTRRGKKHAGIVPFEDIKLLDTPEDNLARPSEV